MRNHYVVDDDTVLITLNRRGGENLVTIVDIHMIQRLLSFDVKWTALWHGDMKSYYAVAYAETDGRRTSYLMHRWLMNAGRSKVVHRNGNTLDNREDNLDIVKRATTRLSLGVHFDKRRGKWFIVGKSYPLAGNKQPERYFDTREQALEAYQKWCSYWKDYTFI